VAVSDLDIFITYRMPNPLIYSAIALLLTQFLSILIFFKLYRDKIFVSNQAKEQLLEIANQVAHDIRSPLSAMNLALSKIDNVDTEIKEVLGTASQRISQIANELLERSRIRNAPNSRSKNQSTLSKNDDGVNLVQIVGQVIAEKRIEYGKNSQISLIEDFNKELESWVLGTSSDIQRIVSNLVNNSIEATRGEEKNIVTVSIRNYEEHIELSVGDSGKGIPAEVIERIGSKGFSFGKSNGNGLGVFDAKIKIESWGGRFKILSQVDSGTLVILTFKCRS